MQGWRLRRAGPAAGRNRASGIEEPLGHAVAFRAAPWSEQRCEAKGAGHFPETPALATADQAMISRSQASITKSSQTLLTIFDRSTDRLCRRGAPVKNLANGAFFQSLHENAQSKSAIKHLGRRRDHMVQTIAATTSLRALGTDASLDLNLFGVKT